MVLPHHLWPASSAHLDGSGLWLQGTANHTGAAGPFLARCVPPVSPTVVPGQPFRLGLLFALASASGDPDAAFIAELLDGVSLGFSSPMSVCPCMFPPTCELDPPMPLSHCTSSWKSALDDPAAVDSLLQAELSEGWVRKVPGGLPQLQSQYVHSAVGKLGLVKAHGRPPRLVVDSSISGVTANTALPNRSANPTFCSLRHCLPTGTPVCTCPGCLQGSSSH